MTIILIGDPHFKANRSSEADVFMDKVCKFLEEYDEEIDKIVILGDVFDTHERIHVKPLIKVTKFLHYLGEDLAPLAVLVGNHDRPNNSIFLTEEHSLFPFKYSQIDIIDTVKVWDDYIFVPYVEPGRFMEALATIGIGEKELKSGKYKAIFAHQEFKGAQMGGIISVSGDEWSKEYPPVFSGHIHQYQVMDNGVTYIGTPYQMSYGDTTKKGIYILDEQLKLERIDLGMMSKIIVTIPITELLDYEFRDDVITKLIIEGNAKEVREMLKKREYKNKLKGVEYSIKDVLPSLPPLEEGEGKKKVTSIPKIIEMLKQKTEDPVEKQILTELF